MSNSNNDDTNTWTPILESLTQLCNDCKVSEEFQKTLRSELIDKALIPIVKEVPDAVGVYPPDFEFAVQALTVHFGWLATAHDGVRLTVHRPLLSHRMTTFIACTFMDETSLDYKAFTVEKQVAEELKSRIDWLRKQDTDHLHKA